MGSQRRRLGNNEGRAATVLGGGDGGGGAAGFPVHVSCMAISGKVIATAAGARGRC